MLKMSPKDLMRKIEQVAEIFETYPTLLTHMVELRDKLGIQTGDVDDFWDSKPKSE